MAPILAGAAVAIAVLAGGIYLATRGGDEATIPATSVPVATTASSTPDEAAATTEPTETDESTAPSTEEGSGASVAELARSTVQILLLADGEVTCSGSGTIVEADGTVLTNAHVVEVAPECPYDTIGVAVTEDSGRPPELLYEADVYAFDGFLDLAVLRIARDFAGNAVSTTFPFVAVGDSDAVQIGDQLRILGYPGIGGDTVTFTRGVVSGFTSQNGVADPSWIKTDATIAGGNSGGAAFDDAGLLIGVPTQASASADSPIVDCRPIDDTNGDGDITADDQCVPIGGFLNGIRPVNLAVPLILEARTGGPIELGPESAPEAPSDFDPANIRVVNPAWSIGPIDETSSEAPEFVVTTVAGVDALCIWFDWTGIPDGVLWDGVWFIDGVAAEDFSFYGETWDLGESGFDNWVCALDQEGLGTGLYEFAFFVEEEFQFVEAINVTTTAVPVHEVTFVNRTNLDICFLFVSPAGARDTGLDELGAEEVLAPEGSITLAVADGAMIFDAYDCGPELIANDYEGRPVTDDLTIDITG